MMIEATTTTTEALLDQIEGQTHAMLSLMEQSQMPVDKFSALNALCRRFEWRQARRSKTDLFDAHRPQLGRIAAMMWQIDCHLARIEQR